MKSSYKDLIEQARKRELETSINTENHKAVNAENSINRMVNLTIKVPLENRRYWLSKAKMEGESLTSVIIDTLNKRFGSPS